MDIVPYRTRNSGANKYETGIANSYDIINGKKYIRWIPMDSSSNYYSYPSSQAVNDSRKAVQDAYASGEIQINIANYLQASSDNYVCYVWAGGNKSGWTLGTGGVKEIWVAEKPPLPDRENSNPKSALDGIQQYVHEFGHLLGVGHFVAGNYETMHWGGLCPFDNNQPYNSYYYCPPHFSPWVKIERGWISPIEVTQDQVVPLPAIDSVGIVAKIALSPQNEYLLVEYRRRLGFNRFTGGLNPSDPTFSGGALIWHYSASTPIFTCTGCQIVNTHLGLKVVGYGQSFKGNPGSPDHFFPYHGSSLDPLTTPSSSLASNQSSGVTLKNFTFDGGTLSFYVGFGPAPPANVTTSVYGSGNPKLNWTPATEPDVLSGGLIFIDRRTKAIIDYDWTPWTLLDAIPGNSSEYIDFSISRACTGSCPDSIEYRLRAQDNAGNSSAYSAVARITGYGIWYKQPIAEFMIDHYELFEAYPNPFNPTTQIRFLTPNDGIVTLKIYDMLGQEMNTLLAEYRSAGSYTVSLDASSYPSGVYFYTMKAGTFLTTKRFVVTK